MLLGPGRKGGKGKKGDAATAQKEPGAWTCPIQVPQPKLVVTGNRLHVANAQDRVPKVFPRSYKS